VEPKSLGFHRTEGTNGKIGQRNALIFARHPIGVTDNQLSAMLTNAIHHIPPNGMHLRSIINQSDGMLLARPSHYLSLQGLFVVGAIASLCASFSCVMTQYCLFFGDSVKKKGVIRR
jgi:hypothetical protein